MDKEKSLEIIHALANGIDPHTGEEYSADSPYQHPQTIRALFTAMQAMEHAKKANRFQGNAGKAWENEEDQRLIKGWHSGKTIKELAEEHFRSVLDISARLVNHSLVP